MSAETYTCGTCGQWLGIAGENTGSDEDFAAEEHYASEVAWHESGQCAAVVEQTAETVEAAPTPDPRAEYIAGLRALAEFLTAHPEVPLPYGAGTASWARSVKLNWYLSSKTEMVAFAKAFPGKLDKHVDEGSRDFGFELHGSLRGLYLYAAVDRDEVCERVVIGTREVTRTVPAPDAPMVEVTETVEDVEWRCSPLLAESGAVA